MNTAPKVVVIDGVTYHAETPMEAEVHSLLSNVFGVLWTEAYYDPKNQSTGDFARPLAEKMIRLNELLGFKK